MIAACQFVNRDSLNQTLHTTWVHLDMKSLGINMYLVISRTGAIQLMASIAPSLTDGMILSRFCLVGAIEVSPEELNVPSGA